MDYIKVNIKVNTTSNNNRDKVIIRKMESSTNRSNVNEIPIILNLLSYSTNIAGDDNFGLPYLLDFKLLE